MPLGNFESRRAVDIALVRHQIVLLGLHLLLLLVLYLRPAISVDRVREVASILVVMILTHPDGLLVSQTLLYLGQRLGPIAGSGLV